MPTRAGSPFLPAAECLASGLQSLRRGGRGIRGCAVGEFLDRFVGNISPAALLASTFFWSWMDLVPFSPLLFTAAGGATNPTVLAVSLLVAACVLAGLACLRTVRECALGAREFALVALACGSVGTVLIFAGSLSGVTLLTSAGGVLAGVFQGAGVVVVGCLAMCQGKTNALIHLAACLPTNIVFVLLGMYLQPGAAVVLCAVLPLLAALSYKVFLVRGTNARTIRSVCAEPVAASRHAASLRPGYVAQLLLVTIAFGFVDSGIQFSGGAAGALSNYVSLFVRAGVAVWVFCSYVFRARQPFELLVTAVAIMAAGVLGLALAPGSGVAAFVGSTAFCVGYAMFDLLLWALIVLAHKGARISLQRFMCVAYALDQLGNFIGTLVGLAPLPTSTSTLVLGVLGVGMIVLAFVLLSTRESALGDLHASVMEADVHPEAAASHQPRPNSAMGQREDVCSEGKAQAVVRQAAARYFLTEREADVLGLLYAGRSVPYISERLVVSQNTVKTHVRHIYAKLDVHGRQELLDVLREIEGVETPVGSALTC